MALLITNANSSSQAAHAMKTVSISGNDLRGVAHFHKNAITLKVTHFGRYDIRLNSDGSISAKIYRKFGILPAVKLSGVRIGNGDFATMLSDLNSNTTTVHAIFSDAIDDLTTELTSYQKEFFINGKVNRYLDLDSHKFRLMTLKNALMESRDYRSNSSVTVGKASDPSITVKN